MAMDRDPFRIYSADDRGYHPLVYFGFRQRKQQKELSGLRAGNLYILRWKLGADTAGEIHIGRRIEEAGEVDIGRRIEEAGEVDIGRRFR